MRDEKPDDEIVDEMPDAGGAPCGDIFHQAEALYPTDADDEEMPAPEPPHCGRPFGDSQETYRTDADEA